MTLEELTETSFKMLKIDKIEKKKREIKKMLLGIYSDSTGMKTSMCDEIPGKDAPEGKSSVLGQHLPARWENPQ